MRSQLCELFYGNKKFGIEHFEQFHKTKSISDFEVREIFEPYTSFLETVTSNDGSITLLAIFSEFIRGNLLKFSDWEFEKLSSWIEISAHIFEHSFQKHLKKKESFEYFSQVVVRHSLFRPPHSVHVFDYEEAKEMSGFWLDSFMRYYEEYETIFSDELNNVLIGVCSGLMPIEEEKDRKEYSKEEFLLKFENIFKIGEN